MAGRQRAAFERWLVFSLLVMLVVGPADIACFTSLTTARLSRGEPCLFLAALRAVDDFLCPPVYALDHEKTTRETPRVSVESWTPPKALSNSTLSERPRSGAASRGGIPKHESAFGNNPVNEVDPFGSDAGAYAKIRAWFHHAVETVANTSPLIKPMKLTTPDKDVAVFIACNKEMTDLVAHLKANGWIIRYGKNSETDLGPFAKGAPKVIQIDENAWNHKEIDENTLEMKEKPYEVLHQLAHELGHARDVQDNHFVPPEAKNYPDAATYKKAYKKQMLANEAEATLFALEMRAAFLNCPKVDIGYGNVALDKKRLKERVISEGIYDTDPKKNREIQKEKIAAEREQTKTTDFMGKETTYGAMFEAEADRNWASRPK